MTHLAIPFAQNGHYFLYSPTVVCYKLLDVSFLLPCEIHSNAKSEVLFEKQDTLIGKTEHESCLVDYTLGINSVMCNLYPMELYTYTAQSGLIGSDTKIHDLCFTEECLPDVDGRIILRWIFRKWDVGAWNRLIWLRIRTDGGH